MLIGVLIATNDYYERSLPNVIGPDDYPKNQKILINQNMRGISDVSSQTFVDNLP